jgi:transposase
MQADTSSCLIEGGLPTEGTRVDVAVSKCVARLPVHRECQIYGQGGVDVERSTLAIWCGVAAHHLAPAVDRMRIHLKRSSPLFMDATRALVPDPKAGNTKNRLPLGGDPR